MFMCVHGWDVERRIWEVRGRRYLGMLEGLHPGVCVPVAAAPWGFSWPCTGEMLCWDTWRAPAPQGQGHGKSQPCPMGRKDCGALLSLMRRCSRAGDKAGTKLQHRECLYLPEQGKASTRGAVGSRGLMARTHGGTEGNIPL